ncbi:hypothetical protein CEP45_08405 [Mergibacter septicus]|uniref:hypothetical protein n=1 Tax=Mergibacter septicus TaxID=221402 RepID=UPI001C74B386|nr:hypothetical protein [Mergibacter septicus]QDJ13844.1 hypothetical protein CEP45_08405 [Mergibacter septicus]
MKLITQMSGKEALEFFLKHENYCNFSLPAYFNFSPLLEEISSSLNKKGSSGINFNKASSHEGVNYKLYTNKNSYYSWRLLELISSSYLCSFSSSNYRRGKLEAFDKEV